MRSVGMVQLGWRSFLLFLGLLATGARPLPARAAARREVDVAHELVPLLKARRARCHTPGNDKVSLALDTRQHLLDAPSAFLNAPAPDRRDRLIRRLLDDRRAYAEHWLTFWNDLLRNDYQGTGYIDGGRKQITGWLYRSLLDNKPYDQFVRELISS